MIIEVANYTGPDTGDYRYYQATIEYWESTEHTVRLCKAVEERAAPDAL